MTESENQDLIKELKRNFKLWKLALKKLEKYMDGADKHTRDMAIYKSVCMLKAMKEFVLKFNGEMENENN